MIDYDYIVVGGGISGLMVALRLASSGAQVGLFERGKLGSEASTGNHGIIHSGALFSVLHPEITDACQEAMRLFQEAFPNAVIPSQNTWYFATPQRIEAFKPLWEQQEIPYTSVETEAWATTLRVDRAEHLSCVSIADLVVSSRTVLVELAQLCLDSGVEIHTMTPVHSVSVNRGRAIGVQIGLQETVRAGRVILCSGLGAVDLTRNINSKVYNRLKSRLDIMISFENKRLNRPIFCLEYGGPALAPTVANVVLVSLYGGKQPSVDRFGKWPVSMAALTEVLRSLDQYIHRDVINLDSGRAYMCSKTEVSEGKADPWGVEPNFAVIDHDVLDGIDNLWSLFPGKMTLVFHATRQLVTRMQRQDPGLAIPISQCIIKPNTEALVADVPWLEPWGATA